MAYVFRPLQGHAAAQYHLAHMYADGRGIARNDAEAAAWFRRAAEQGDADAQHELDKLVE
ncbi:MAG: SEL1-like repeat protein [Xanthobacteraceae bacterium]|nr:SEL1-like repeat protein [Xanthobacteraceae bacterium]